MVRQTVMRKQTNELARDVAAPVVAANRSRRPALSADRQRLDGPLRSSAYRVTIHAAEQLPVHDVATVTVEKRTQIVERTGDVDVGNIDVPMLVRP